MPGYLTNRYISFNLNQVNEDLEAIQASIETVQGDVEDLQLNLGV